MPPCAGSLCSYLMADLWTEEFILGSDTIVHVNGADEGGVETRLSFLL
jgi:hypothetical protein